MKYIETFRKISLYRDAACRAMDLEIRLEEAGDMVGGERAGQLYAHFHAVEIETISDYRTQSRAEISLATLGKKGSLLKTRRLAERLYKKYQHQSEPLHGYG
ncbi:MAG: hypothetical protein RR365_14790 [Bacteroides sp.]